MAEYSELARAEIVICGGGVSGVFAAVAARESGAEVLLLEQQGCLGGSAVAGLVSPMMTSRLPGGVENSYLSPQLGKGPAFDPASLDLALAALCREAGVRILLNVALCQAQVEDGRVVSVTVATCRGLETVSGQVFVDCTGDALLSKLAGAQLFRGRDGVNQPMSLRYLMGGVDLVRFGAFLDQWGAASGLPHTARSGNGGQSLYAAVTAQGDWALTPVFRQAVAVGDLKEEDCVYFQLFPVAGRPDALAMNHPEFLDLPDATDPFQRTEVLLRGREAIARQIAFCRKYFPGCEKAYLLQVAPMVGVRESRRVGTEYLLTARELLDHTKFPDRVAQSNYPVDIHGGGLESYTPHRDPKKPWFEVPYRCLVVKGLYNLLVAGRCVGADFVAQSAIRIQPTCRALGEAAGIAAALARDCPAAQVDGVQVGRIMESRGAVFL